MDFESIHNDYVRQVIARSDAITNLMCIGYTFLFATLLVKVWYENECLRARCDLLCTEAANLRLSSSISGKDKDNEA